MESCSATLSLTGLPLLKPSGHRRPNSPRIRSGRNCIAGAISGARPESSDTGSAPSAGRRSRGPDRRSRRAVDAPDVLDHRVRVQRSYKRFLIASDSAHASPCSTRIHEGISLDCGAMFTTRPDRGSHRSPQPVLRGSAEVEHRHRVQLGERVEHLHPAALPGPFSSDFSSSTNIVAAWNSRSQSVPARRRVVRA